MNEAELLCLYMHSHPKLPIIGSSGGSGASARGPHRLGSIKICRKQWSLRYHYKLTPKAQKPWTMGGTLIHQALAYHYVGMMPEADQPEWSRVETLEESLYRLGEGVPHDVRDAIECGEWYRNATAGEAVRPIAVEREFSALIGEIDPDGIDEAEIHWESDACDAAGQPLRSFHAPRLNEERITCRIDLVVEEGGVLYIWDHKTKALDWRAGHKLPKWNDNGEYSLNWQVLINLILARHELGADRIAGFKIHRLSRDRPFQRDIHELQIPARAYQDAPRSAREAVRLERELGLALAKGGKADANYSACYAKYGDSDYASACDYVSLCKATSDQEVRDRLVNDYRSM